jgi:cytochrome c-type biogenesis protein CcmE
MTRRQRRLTIIGVIGVILVAAAGLTLWGLSDRIMFFNSPTEILAQNLTPGTRIRLGGLVADGSVVDKGGGNVNFAVTDGTNSIPVSYTGILPDLFREGQGVVAEGVIAAGGTFTADTILAKHDERYMPADVVAALKAQGVWDENADSAKPPPAPVTPAKVSAVPAARTGGATQ